MGMITMMQRDDNNDDDDKQTEQTKINNVNKKHAAHHIENAIFVAVAVKMAAVVVVVYRKWSSALLPFLVHVPHIDDLVLKLLHRPHLRAFPFTLHQDRRLTHKRGSLEQNNNNDDNNSEV